MTRNAAAARNRKRKSITILWIAALAFVTIFLIYREMTALLYILATLGVTALLAVVALADLSPGNSVFLNKPPAD